MRNRLLLLVVLAGTTTACPPDLSLVGGMQLTCSDESPVCPAPLVCVPAIRRCMSTIKPCIQSLGQGWEPKENGSSCADAFVTEGGICVEGECQLGACGDGFVHTQGGEICDDGNEVDGDGCDSNCTPTTCGNGVVTEGELCDDGNRDDLDECDLLCRPTRKWRGEVVLDPTESVDEIALAFDGLGNAAALWSRDSGNIMAAIWDPATDAFSRASTVARGEPPLVLKGAPGGGFMAVWVENGDVTSSWWAPAEGWWTPRIVDTHDSFPGGVDLVLDETGNALAAWNYASRDPIIWYASWDGAKGTWSSPASVPFADGFGQAGPPRLALGPEGGVLSFEWDPDANGDALAVCELSITVVSTCQLAVPADGLNQLTGLTAKVGDDGTLMVLSHVFLERDIRGAQRAPTASRWVQLQDRTGAGDFEPLDDLDFTLDDNDGWVFALRESEESFSPFIYVSPLVDGRIERHYIIDVASPFFTETMAVARDDRAHHHAVFGNDGRVWHRAWDPIAELWSTPVEVGENGGDGDIKGLDLAFSADGQGMMIYKRDRAGTGSTLQAVRLGEAIGQ